MQESMCLVKFIKEKKLDPDLLDERARAMLNAAHPDDVIIFHHDGYQDMTTIAAHTN